MCPEWTPLVLKVVRTPRKRLFDFLNENPIQSHRQFRAETRCVGPSLSGHLGLYHESCLGNLVTNRCQTQSTRGPGIIFQSLRKFKFFSDFANFEVACPRGFEPPTFSSGG